MHYILDLVEYEGRDRPIKPEELHNPQSKAACIILYMYSMDSPFTNAFNQVYTENSKNYATNNDYKKIL